jgi:hypothetical protein
MFEGIVSDRDIRSRLVDEPACRWAAVLGRFQVFLTP